MTFKVLVVDDSRFFCKRIQDILEEDPDLNVVGVAHDGEQALNLAAQLEPDVITMDVEMPVLDGISAVKKIMADCPTGILMLSASTYLGAQATLDALNAGAVDFVSKQLDEVQGNTTEAKKLLRQRVRMVARHSRLKFHKRIVETEAPGIESFKTTSVRDKSVKHSSLGSSLFSINREKPELLVILASTGGPVAIQNILPRISAECGFPVLIIQHMPQNFTHSFAERLNEFCDLSVKEASPGDELTNGKALLAPGGMQMEVRKNRNKLVVGIRNKIKGEIFSPCADITLSSLGTHELGSVLIVVLTGMGSDGRNGLNEIKKKGVTVWAQEESSCTIYGMPKAVIESGLADKVLSLDDIADGLANLK